MTKENIYDVVIVGAGLSGLTAGISLQLQGLRTRIIEKNNRAGGLCGNHTLDGYEFTIACNDFGLGMQRELHKLGVEITFEPKKTVVHHEDDIYSIPPNSATVVQLLLNLPSVIRYYRRAIGNKSADYRKQDINRFVNKLFRGKTINSLLKLPAYLMGVSPSDFYVKALGEESRYKYGYHKPLTPKGGPDQLVESLVNRYSELGGELTLNCSFQGSTASESTKELTTSTGTVLSTHLLTTHDWSSHQSGAIKQGLPLSMLHIAVSKSLAYPKDVHTLVHYPKGIDKWFVQLDSGKQPDIFGFHIFKCGTQHSHDYTPINVYFYQPRQEDGIAYSLDNSVENYILTNIEKILPGFTNAILYKRYLSPNEFIERHGLSSRVMPYVMPPDFKKPENYDHNTKIYHAGNAYQPPGDHAGAAIQSGLFAANTIVSNIGYGDSYPWSHQMSAI